MKSVFDATHLTVKSTRMIPAPAPESHSNAVPLRLALREDHRKTASNMEEHLRRGGLPSNQRAPSAALALFTLKHTSDPRFQASIIKAI